MWEKGGDLKMTVERIRECSSLRLKGESSGWLDAIKPSSSLRLPERIAPSAGGLQNQGVSEEAQKRSSRSVHEVTVMQS